MKAVLALILLLVQLATPAFAQVDCVTAKVSGMIGVQNPSTAPSVYFIDFDDDIKVRIRDLFVNTQGRGLQIHRGDWVCTCKLFVARFFADGRPVGKMVTLSEPLSQVFFGIISNTPDGKENNDVWNLAELVVDFCSFPDH